MGDYTNLKLTDIGLALQTKVQTGTTLSFSRFGLGDGTFVYPGDVPTMTSLVSEKMTLSIGSVTRPDDTHFSVNGVIATENLPATGFELKEIGLFANDPDVGEILYGAIYAINPDYIPSSGSNYEYVINIVGAIGETDTVSISVNSAVAATKQELTEHKKELDPTDTDTAKDKHLSNAQGKKWEDHVEKGANDSPHGYTAEDVLTKIKSVDGSGSGLDADMIDGKHLSELLTFSQIGATRTTPGTWTLTGITIGKPLIITISNNDTDTAGFHFHVESGSNDLNASQNTTYYRLNATVQSSSSVATSGTAIIIPTSTTVEIYILYISCDARAYN